MNYCIDCSIPSTYVRTADGELFDVRMEDDVSGDDKREASVKSCAELVFIENEGIRCVDAERLYFCRDDR